DSEYIQTRPIREFDPLDQMADTVRRTDFNAGVVVRESRGETVNANLHLPVLLLRVQLSVFSLTSPVRFQ
ncbi:MAG TPA: hypothetical protein VK840_03395, partial [Candidatus Dormibacteraeota bacterium]|nr:hypothetical protein [Candidatus Dormibacteraeota bacterium]